MNILKPQKVFFNNLEKVENLLDEIEKSNDSIKNKTIIDTDFEDIKIYDTEFETIEFSNTNILNSKIEKNTFTDVIFNNCNFSNTSFEGCSFIRCEFNNCKITGCNFTDSKLYNVCLKETNANYINLSMASIENVLFDNTGLRNSNLFK